MPRPLNPRHSVRVSSELRRAIEKYIPSDDWVDLAETVPGVVFGIDLAKEGGDFTAEFHAWGTPGAMRFERHAPLPPMRNVTPPKPKLLKESNE